MKRLVVAIITLAFIGLWATPTQADPPPTKVEPAKAEPAKAEPAKAEPTKAEPTKAEPAKAEPTKAEPTKAEPKKEEAKTEPAKGDPKDPVQNVNMLIQAIKDGEWPLAAGLLLALLIVILNRVVRLQEIVGKKAVPWVAAGLAVVGTLSTGLVAGLPWKGVLISGLLTGAAAIAFWELVLKHWLRKKDEDEPPTLETTV